MQNTDVMEYTRAVIRALVECPLLEVDSVMVMDAIPDWNVNRYVKLIVGIEQRFGVWLPSDDYMRFKTVGDLVEGVMALLLERAQGEAPRG